MTAAYLERVAERQAAALQHALEAPAEDGAELAVLRQLQQPQRKLYTFHNAGESRRSAESPA